MGSNSCDVCTVRASSAIQLIGNNILIHRMCQLMLTLLKIMTNKSKICLNEFYSRHYYTIWNRMQSI